MRRANIVLEKKLEIGNLILDEDDVSAAVDGEPVILTLREFQILFKLLSYPKRIFIRSQLLEEFLGIENESGLRTVDVHIANIRAKFARCSAFQIASELGWRTRRLSLPYSPLMSARHSVVVF